MTPDALFLYFSRLATLDLFLPVLLVVFLMDITVRLLKSAIYGTN